MAGLTIALTMSVSAFAADETAAADAAKKDFGSLKVSYTDFVDGSQTFGSYPSVEGLDSLNSKIKSDISDFFASYSSVAIDDDDSAAGASVSSSVTDDSGAFSKIEVTAVTRPNAPDRDERVFTYYVDKSSNSEITEDAYTAGLASAAEEKDDETADDQTGDEKKDDETGLTDAQIKEILSTMVPLRANVEKAGLSVTWEPDISAVKVYDGAALTAVVFVGDSNYISSTGDGFDLGIAPENRNGSIYVPASFFNSILGLDVNVDDDGKITSFSAPEAADDKTTSDDKTDVPAADSADKQDVPAADAADSSK
jgi:hypothetical protein